MAEAGSTGSGKTSSAYDLAECFSGGIWFVNLRFREAAERDLVTIVGMLADDQLGQAREASGEPIDQRYLEALNDMATQNGNRLIVAEADGNVVGCFQIIVLPGIARRGARRAQVESVRVERSMRGRGIGRQMLGHAVAIAREDGCELMQLTAHGSRQNAHRFYESLGFEPTHLGFKMSLNP